MLFAAAAILALTAAINAQSVTIDVPNLAQCASSVINLSGSTGPYYVAIVPAGNPCESAPLQEFYDVSELSIPYQVTLPEGTQVIVYVEDVTQAEYWSNTLTVGSGDISCLQPPVEEAPEVTPEEVTPEEEAPTSSLVYTPPAPETNTPTTLTPQADDTEIEDTEESVDTEPFVPEDTPANVSQEDSGAAGVTVSFGVALTALFASVSTLL